MRKSPVFVLVTLTVFGIMLALSWLFQTSNGAAVFLKLIMPQTVSTDQVQGRLGKLNIKNLTIKSHRADFLIANCFAQSHFDFKTRTLVFDRLTLNHVQIIPHRLPLADHKPPFLLPINLVAKNIQFHNVMIRLSQNNVITIPSLQASAVSRPKQQWLMIYSNEQKPCLGIFQNSDTHRYDFFAAIHTKAVTLNGQGHLTNQWNANWTLRIADLKKLLPNSNGLVISDGNVSGALKRPIVTGRLIGTHLQFEQYQLEEALSDFRLDFTSKYSPSRCHITANHLRVKDTAIANFRLQIMGTLASHSLAMQTQLKDQQLKCHINGEFNAFQWVATIDNFMWQNLTQKWQLATPSQFTIDQDKMLLKNFNLDNQGHKIVINGRYQKNEIYSGNIGVVNLNLNMLKGFLGDKQRLEGNLTFNANFNHSNHKDELDVKGKLSAGNFYFPLDQEIKKSSFNGGEFTAAINKNQTLQILGSIVLPAGHISATIALPHFSFKGIHRKTQIIQAKILAKLNSLLLLETLIPPIKNLTGNLSADYTVSGSLSAPVIHGHLALQQGSFRIPKANLLITNVNINTQLVDKTIQYAGSMTSGNGVLSLQGNTKLDNHALPTHLQIQGNPILIYNTPEIKITASPKLNLEYVNSLFKLSGNLLITDATIHLRDLNSAVYASDDIIFIDADGKEKTRSPLKVETSLLLTLSDNIYLNFQGLKGQVVGQLRIEDHPHKATVAYGQLRLKNGIYTLYNTTLKIDEGTLNFTGGPIANPGIDIRATRTIQALNTSTFFTKQEEIQVGVSVIGPAKNAKTNLFSIPAGKDPPDILSYLVLGVPASSTNEANSKLLLQAASTLDSRSGKGLSGIKEKIQQKLGLSEMTIGTQTAFDQKTQETLEHTSFVLGKYLSPKFYVNYTLDFFDHTNTFKVRYLLNRFWTIQSVANMKASGIDVLYTIEK